MIRGLTALVLTTGVAAAVAGHFVDVRALGAA